MDKKKLSLAGFGALAAAVIVIISVIAFGGKGGKTDSSRADSSMPAAAVMASSAAETVSSVPEVSAAEGSQTFAEAREDSSAADALSSAAETPSDDSREYKQYSFRSKKLFESHYQKHGSEFGSITKEEYLKLANDLLNSDSPSVLHKTEKEDGDTVYFDTETGYFLVLSTDGYIRTFFIPDKGIDYYNRQ
ncbi:hypothetical protein SAMN02910317_00008 [Ruminococcaceae bacterium FB2012]|nr:hypothetical protein SAMN02910317_00008 [Ruminococcaceae bacterium FB2012]